MTETAHDARNVNDHAQITCPKCNGSGTRFDKGFTACDGTVYPDRTRNCYYCDGRGHYVRPDYVAICKAIKGRKGLCSKRPADGRAYYVWRMARFHGGADVTMPVMAWTLEIEGDPYRATLDKLADIVAVKVYGTRCAAAHRWGRALGHIERDVPGLPATAYEHGPVCLDGKPIEELPELL